MGWCSSWQQTQHFSLILSSFIQWDFIPAWTEFTRLMWPSPSAAQHLVKSSLIRQSSRIMMLYSCTCLTRSSQDMKVLLFVHPKTHVPSLQQGWVSHRWVLHMPEWRYPSWACASLRLHLLFKPAMNTLFFTSWGSVLLEWLSLHHHRPCSSMPGSRYSTSWLLLLYLFLLLFKHLILTGLRFSHASPSGAVLLGLVQRVFRGRWGPGPGWRRCSLYHLSKDTRLRLHGMEEGLVTRATQEKRDMQIYRQW